MRSAAVCQTEAPAIQTSWAPNIAREYLYPIRAEIALDHGPAGKLILGVEIDKTIGRAIEDFAKEF